MNVFTKSLATVAGVAALTFGFVAPEAKAYSSCSTYGNTTYCNGSGGSRSTYSTYGGTTYYNGRDSYGNSYRGSCSTYGSTTYCN